MSKTVSLPRHVAIVMDGNGRWAKKRHLPRVAGHEEGVKAIERAVRFAGEQKIQVLTLFTWGIENWGRPEEEINFIMQLFAKTLENQAENFQKNNVRFRVIGDAQGIHSELQVKIRQLETLTENNTGLVLVLAFNYSGRWDILQATKKVNQKIISGQLQLEDVSYADIHHALCLSDLPEPDLFIRTSGEQRISNFLLWQLAYTELFFTDILWPDFNETVFSDALSAFARRERRYGLVQTKVNASY